MIKGWKDWFNNGNAKGSAPVELGPRTPRDDPQGAIDSEVIEATKQMGKIRALEAELKGKNPDTAYGAEAADWDMLSSMKKDLG